MTYLREVMTSGGRERLLAWRKFFNDGVWPFGLGGRALNVYVWCFWGRLGTIGQANIVAVIQQHTGHWPFGWQGCY